MRLPARRYAPAWTRIATGLLLLSVATLACRFTAPGQQATLDVTQPAQVVDLSATPAAATLTPTPSACPVQRGPAVLPPPGPPSDIASGILEYLNHGGNPVELHSHLEQAGRSLPAEQGLAQMDLTGDGIAEIALVLLTEGELPSTPPGLMMIFTCAEQGYTIGYTTPAPLDRGAPMIHSLDDLTGDNLSDLLLERELCGAHTCTAEIRVIAWQSGSFRDVFPDSTVELPSPHVEVGPQGAGGARAISITATGINSIGAGPFRQVTYTWTWDSDQKQFVLDSQVQAPATFRIHVLHEADERARAGDLEQALDLYQRVEEDPDLDPWIDEQRERRILGAYAHFRRVVLNVRFGQIETASELFQEAVLDYTSHPETMPYVEMTESYWRTFQSTQSTLDACLRARSFASAHSGQVLEPLYFGYANPSYSAEDVCTDSET